MTTRADNSVNQSYKREKQHEFTLQNEFMAFLTWRLPAENRHRSEEIRLLCNFSVQGTICLGFNSHWLREWGEIVK